MAIYETIFILDSLMPPKEIDTTVQRYSGMINENGGMVRKIDKWGKRRLAYEIKKKQYGFYVAIEFEGSGAIPKLLESDYNYNDKVMRYLTYRYDKNKLKAMEMEEKEHGKKETSKGTSQPLGIAPAPVDQHTANQIGKNETLAEPMEQSELEDSLPKAGNDAANEEESKS